MSAIDLRDLRVVYRRKGEADRVALDGLSLQAENEMLAMLGPNGAGKSTLMGVIAQTVRPESGSCVSPSSRRGLSIVFQTPALDVLLTVRENLRVAGALHGVDRRAINERTESLCGALGISDRLDEQVRHLSGGLARRADLARALMAHPAVLLLDEPTTGLDIDTRRSFWASMDRIRERLGMTVLLATHLIDEAERADRVALISHGRCVGIGTPEVLRCSLGERVLRIGSTDDGTLDAAMRWAESIGVQPHRVEGSVVIPNASSDLLEQCPVRDASLTLAPPSLEDVYSIRTREGVGV